MLDQRRILLERPAQRLLATQPHLRQQSTHRDRTELDAVLSAKSACRSSLSSRAQREIAAEADFSMSRYCRSISTETPSTASDARSPCAREAHPIRQHDRLPTTQIPWPGKDEAHAPPPLAAVQPALLSPQSAAADQSKRRSGADEVPLLLLDIYQAQLSRREALLPCRRLARSVSSCLATIRPKSGVKPTCQDSSTDAFDPCRKWSVHRSTGKNGDQCRRARCQECNLIQYECGQAQYLGYRAYKGNLRSDSAFQARSRHE